MNVRPISDESIKSIGIKTHFMPRAVVLFINIYNSLAYDWIVKDDWLSTLTLNLHLKSKGITKNKSLVFVPVTIHSDYIILETGLDV
jgi:hypothetical protein